MELLNIIEKVLNYLKINRLLKYHEQYICYYIHISNYPVL